MIGDGECRSECEQLAVQLEIEDSIEFWGIRHDVSDILRAVDVFTLTSVSEAASLTLLEAMASSCPSVITDVGGNAEHVTHGKEGLLAPRGDSQKIAKHLATLLSKPDVAATMGKNARDRVVRDFNLQQVIEDYASHYRELTTQ